MDFKELYQKAEKNARRLEKKVKEAEQEIKLRQLHKNNSIVIGKTREKSTLNKNGKNTPANLKQKIETLQRQKIISSRDNGLTNAKVY